MKKLVLLIIIALCSIACREQHVFWSYYGYVDIDTLEYSFDDFQEREPCYKVHTEIREMDTFNVYLYPWKGIYYRSIKDSLGRTGYVAYEPSIDFIYDSTYIYYTK